MQRTALFLVSLTALAAFAPLGGAQVPAVGVDFDGDGIPNALENLLGSSQYLAADTPVEVGVNALVNSGFEVQLGPARAVTCPVFGDYEVVTPLVILSPCNAGALRHAAWSSLAQAPATENRDYDGDGDLEMVVPLPMTGNNAHNFWQSYANPQQAFSANFRVLSFDLEINSPTPPNLRTLAPYGRVQISTGLAPFSEVNQWVLLYVECALTFTSAQLMDLGTWTPIPAGTRTYWHVEIEPTAIPLGSYYPGCDAIAAAYNAGTHEERHEILNQMRIVQTSFWAFNGLVIDNVDLRDSHIAENVDGVDVPPVDVSSLA